MGYFPEKFKVPHSNKLRIQETEQIRLLEELKQKETSSSTATQKNNPNYTAAVHNSPKSTCLQHNFAIQITAGLLVLIYDYVCQQTASLILQEKYNRQTNL